MAAWGVVNHVTPTSAPTAGTSQLVGNFGDLRTFSTTANPVVPVVQGMPTVNCQPTACQASVNAAKNQLINDVANGIGKNYTQRPPIDANGCDANSRNAFGEPCYVSKNSPTLQQRAQQIQAQEAACNSFTGTSNNVITY